MFHLSIPVRRFSETLEFYAQCFGAEVVTIGHGVANVFVFGAQVTLHDKPRSALTSEGRRELHFGQVVALSEWRTIRDRLVERGYKLMLCIDDMGDEGGKAKLVVADPSGNLVEVNSRPC